MTILQWEILKGYRDPLTEQRKKKAKMTGKMTEKSKILEYFKYNHLPPRLALVSEPFCVLSQIIENIPTSNPAEKETALRKLLESKDAAVRAALSKPFPRE